MPAADAWSHELGRAAARGTRTSPMSDPQRPEPARPSEPRRAGGLTWSRYHRHADGQLRAARAVSTLHVGPPDTPRRGVPSTTRRVPTRRRRRHVVGPAAAERTCAATRYGEELTVVRRSSRDAGEPIGRRRGRTSVRWSSSPPPCASTDGGMVTIDAGQLHRRQVGCESATTADEPPLTLDAAAGDRRRPGVDELPALTHGHYPEPVASGGRLLAASASPGPARRRPHRPRC